MRTIPASRKCFSISGAWGINGTLFVEVEHGIVYKQRYQIFIYRDNRFYSWLKEKREEKGLSYKIEIDGGVNKNNIAEIAGNGVDIIVAGTAVFNGNITENINTLKEVL